MSLARWIIGGSAGRRLQTDLITNRASSSGSNSHSYSGIGLGSPHPTRTFFLMYSARTNTTTGPRRLSSAAMVVGGVTHVFTYVRNPGVIHNPRGILQLELPEGETGNLNIAVSGNSTGWVSGLISLWSARGRFERIDDASVGSTLTLDTEQNGVVLMQAANFSGESLGVPTNTNVNDGSFTLNGLTVRSRRNTSTPADSLTISTSNASASVGVSLAQR